MARALALKDNSSSDEQDNMKWQTLQVSTLSIASCAGRILIGTGLSGVYSFVMAQTSYRTGVTADFGNHRGVRRAWCISIVAASFLISQLVGLCVRDIEHLQYAVALVGISYGGVFGLLPTIVIEWFGMGTRIRSFLLESRGLTCPLGSLSSPVIESWHTAHFSENWGLVSLSPLVAGNIFSMIFGWISDAHSSYGGDGMCCLEGAGCYSASLYVTTCACLCALILAFVAAKRDKRYR